MWRLGVAPSPRNCESDRLAAAWAESIAQRGYTRTTVRHLLELSGLSRRAFYGRFAGKEQAFLAIHTAALDALAARVDAGAGEEADWPRRVAAGIEAALRALAEQPNDALILLGDPFAAGPRMGRCHELLIARFAPCLAQGRKHAASPRSIPGSLEAALLGSLIAILSARVRAGSTAELPALAAPLTEFVLGAYCDPDRARRVAAAPPLGSRVLQVR